MESVHKKLSRVRKPRVHITYDVETEGGVTKKELPYIVGVLGDYSGNGVPESEKKPLKERKFIDIHRDNFDKVMQNIGPRVNLKVKNKLSNDDTEMAVELNFKGMQDFEPGKIIDQVEPLKKLLETRNHIRDLLSKADKSDNLEDVLAGILKDNDSLKTFADELGIENITDKD